MIFMNLFHIFIKKIYPEKKKITDHTTRLLIITFAALQNNRVLNCKFARDHLDVASTTRAMFCGQVRQHLSVYLIYTVGCFVKNRAYQH